MSFSKIKLWIPKSLSKKSMQGDNPQKWVNPIDSKSCFKVVEALYSSIYELSNYDVFSVDNSVLGLSILIY
jgi:hypothetical protein